MTKEKIGKIGVLAICLGTFAYMADLVIIPAADTIFTYYGSTYPMWVLNTILTGAQLLGILGALMTPLFTRRWSKKSVLVVFFAIFTVCSCLGAVTDNAYYVLVMRLIVGFCFGIVYSVGLALLAYLFRDDEKRYASSIGSYNGTMTIIGAVASLASGILCVYGWQSCYFVYLISIPILLLMIFFIPKTPSDREDEAMNAAAAASGETTVAGKRTMQVGALVFLLISLFAAAIVFNTTSYECSMYIAQTGLGDSVLAGIVTFVICAGTALAAFLFGPIYGKLRRGTMLLGFACELVGLLGLSVVLGRAWMIVAFFILGWSNGLLMSVFMEYAARLVPTGKESLVMGLDVAVVGVGAFLSSFVATGLQTAAGGNLVMIWPIYAIVSAIFVVIYIVIALKDRKSAGADIEETPVEG